MRTLVVLMKPHELEEINRLRRREGLPIIEPGIMKCLRCDGEFESWDKRNNRICEACKSDDEYNSECEVYDLPEDVLYRLKASNFYDRMLLGIEYGFDRGIHPNRNIEEQLLDTTLMDREDL